MATSGGGTTYSYGYDARGNRTTATGTTALAHNAANQITTSGYTYDAAGNLTKTPSLSSVTYNGAGQMTAATTSTGTGTYTYAGTSQTELTHQTTDTGDNIDYVYGRPDGNGQPVIEQVTLDAGTAYIDHDPTTGQPLVLRTTTGTEAYYIIDGFGSPVEFINQSTVTSTVYQYDPYGAYQTTTATGSAAAQNPYRYVGGTYDRTTGWIKYGQRWYNPTTGRFTTQDAHSFLTDPAQGNRYAYAGDDPINNTDPTGKFSLSLGGVVGAVVGGATSAAFDGFFGPVLGGAASGCLSGSVTALIDGSSVSEACAEGATLGAVSGGAGATVKYAKNALRSS
ncbi:RHS repeat-associated core domain-containing protein [Streptomyces sp. NPDC087422]|uniref:RHS repeat-associated core domain-containing protein n=1 Tax=Streptomyces sp. NPDC087422 TaxID=3365786 RepID=UPI003812C335